MEKNLYNFGTFGTVSKEFIVVEYTEVSLIFKRKRVWFFSQLQLY